MIVSRYVTRGDSDFASTSELVPKIVAIKLVQLESGGLPLLEDVGIRECFYECISWRLSSPPGV